MANCKKCIRFATCKFVEKNREFAKQMSSMFEYPEWNNLEEIFHKHAGCQFFVDSEVSIDELLKKIETAQYQMSWIHDYIKKPNLDAAFVIEKLLGITENYKKELEK